LSEIAGEDAVTQPRFFTQGSWAYKTLNAPAQNPQQADLDDGAYPRYSHQQFTRLIKRGCERRQLIKRYQGSRTSFACIYTGADVLLLAHTDTMHGSLSGPTTKKLMERAYGIFGDMLPIPANLKSGDHPL